MIFSFNFDLSNLKIDIYKSKVLFSKNSISYIDENNYVVPFSVDINKFNDEHLNNVLSYNDNKYVTMNLTLEYEENSKTIFLDKKNYDILNPIRNTKYYNNYEYTYPVRVFNNSKETKGLLKLRIIVKRV